MIISNDIRAKAGYEGRRPRLRMSRKLTMTKEFQEDYHQLAMRYKECKRKQKFLEQYHP
jgi:hypothetical protein